MTLKINTLKKVIALCIIAVLSFSLTGCWDLNDINDRAIILAIGIDFAEIPQADNYENSEMIKLTAQLAIPPKLGGGAGESAPMGEESVWNISAIGRNVEMALMHLREKLQYQLFLGHIRVMVIHERVARMGINKHLNYFRNNPTFRKLSYIIISENKAEEVLNTYPQTAITQGVYLMNMLEKGIQTGRVPDVPFVEFVVRLVNKGVDPIAVMVITEGEDIINITGSAVFKGDKMVGKLDVEETWNFIQLAENKYGGVEVVRDVGTELGRVSILFSEVSSALRPVYREGKYTFKVDTNIEGRAISQETQTDYSDPVLFRELENRVSREFMREITALVYMVQHQYQADIFGFGEMVKAYLPRKWEGIKDWREKFVEAELDLAVRTKIRRIGMSTFKQK